MKLEYSFITNHSLVMEVNGEKVMDVDLDALMFMYKYGVVTFFDDAVVNAGTTITLKIVER
jgi:hypothetical protein